jgi:hypothetical protein
MARNSVLSSTGDIHHNDCPGANLPAGRTFAAPIFFNFIRGQTRSGASDGSWLHPLRARGRRPAKLETQDDPSDSEAALRSESGSRPCPICLMVPPGGEQFTGFIWIIAYGVNISLPQCWRCTNTLRLCVCSELQEVRLRLSRHADPTQTDPNPLEVQWPWAAFRASSSPCCSALTRN